MNVLPHSCLANPWLPNPCPCPQPVPGAWWLVVGSEGAVVGGGGEGRWAGGVVGRRATARRGASLLVFGACGRQVCSR